MLIQIVEDDRALSDGIVLALRESGMEFIQNKSIKSAKESFQKSTPNLIILDLNLPDGSGYDYLRWVRECAQIPILILTANDMEMDEVMGLTLGADDYMTKPFSLAVLRARIQVLLRRSRKTQDDIYEEDEFRFDFGSLSFARNGKEIALSVNEQRLLKLLIENRGRILMRSTLIDRLWSSNGEYVDENALSVTVNRLRGKLEDGKDDVSYIQTVYRQGYRWKREDRSCLDEGH
ncbi:MAG: response regulator transcription factor [Lachnospiraceae bacterium]|nr:response regulator transcription factor [Lachnospiraceae bacterium]